MSSSAPAGGARPGPVPDGNRWDVGMSGRSGKDRTVSTSEDLPCPPPWRPRSARVWSVVAAGIVAVVVAVFLVAALASIAGGGPVALLDPAIALDALVRLFRAGPVPWTGAVGVVLLVVAVPATLGASSGQERLVRTADGEWALRFAQPVARRWRSALSGLGVCCLMVVLPDVTGVAGVFQVVVALAVAWSVVALLVRSTVFLLVPARRERIELTGSGLVRYSSLGARQRVAWDDVVRVAPIVRGSGERRRELIGVYLRPGATVEGGDRWRNLRSGADLALEPGSVTTRPERLFWACVAFLDPVRREALLDGAEITAAG